MSENTNRKTIAENQYWLRLATAQHGPVKQQLLCVLHNKNKNTNYQGLPEDPSQLYHALSTTHKPTINQLIKKKVLKDDQIELLLPTNGDKKTFSEKFDLTLIVLLIINCTTLQPPVNGWFKSPPDSDTSVAANVLRARAWRNFLNHTDFIDKNEFETKWKEGIAILTGLGGSAKDMTSLKTISLDPKHEVVMKSLLDFNERKTEKVQRQTTNNTTKITDLDKRLDHQSKQAIADSEEREKQTEQKFQEMQQVQDSMKTDVQNLKQQKSANKSSRGKR